MRKVLVVLLCGGHLLLGMISCKKITTQFYPCEEKVFWEAVKMAESGGNPKLIYEEKGGELSVGLYQLSIGDAQRYGCFFNSMQDMFDPGKNTDCKNKIAAKLRERYPDEPWDIALARYWGTMRSRKNPYWKEYFIRYPNHSGYENLQAEAKKLNCVIKD